MITGLSSLQKEVRKNADSERAALLQRFFKTGKGQYGEGDIFHGIMVPQSRLIAKQFCYLELKDLENLLKSKYHEERLIALFILIKKYSKGDEKQKKKIFDLYLKNTKYINNWDLVDLSAPNIVGNYLLDKERIILYNLAKSNDLWKKRIAILATAAFIRQNDFKDILKISDILLNDEHDLIHKAVGWMLREVGKRDLDLLEKFLEKRYKLMPRTMLRYAIEKMDDDKRKFYLTK